MSYQSNFLVIRQDDNGVKYVVADKLTQHEAELLVERLSARGHKQMFFSLDNGGTTGGNITVRCFWFLWGQTSAVGKPTALFFYSKPGWKLL